VDPHSGSKANTPLDLGPFAAGGEAFRCRRKKAV